MAIRGMRVDPGMCYGLFGGAEATAKGIVRECHEMGVDALFVVAYSYAHGAYYRASAPRTWIEGQGETDFGQDDILLRILDAAQAVGMRVIGSFWMNRYEPRNHGFAEWAAKKKDGTPYRTLQSAWHPDFRDWLRTVLEECIDLAPGLNGLEAWEGVVALDGETNPATMPDYSKASLDAFAARHPNTPPMGDVWLDHRAQGMTELHRLLFRVAHSLAGGRAFFVQDLAWDINAKRLMDFRSYARLCGTDFRALSSPVGPPAERADFANIEAIWQQRKSEHPAEAFDPDWTKAAVSDFVARLAMLGGAKPLGHVEVTPAPPPPSVGQFVPNPVQFETALRHAFTLTSGATIYDYTQVRRNPGYVDAVRRVYTA